MFGEIFGKEWYLGKIIRINFHFSKVTEGEKSHGFETKLHVQACTVSNVI